MNKQNNLVRYSEIWIFSYLRVAVSDYLISDYLNLYALATSIHTFFKPPIRHIPSRNPQSVKMNVFAETY